MITFTSINVDGKRIEYKYKDATEIEREWKSDNIDMNVPANDDPIYNVMIDGKEVWVGNLEDNEKGDDVWFEDLLTYLGIEIW